jgi:hypothetical protein
MVGIEGTLGGEGVICSGRASFVDGKVGATGVSALGGVDAEELDDGTANKFDETIEPQGISTHDGFRSSFARMRFASRTDDMVF